MGGLISECLIQIGDSIGKQEFASFSEEVLKIVLQIQDQVTNSRDKNVIYLLGAWEKIPKIFNSSQIEPIIEKTFNFLELALEETNDRYNKILQEDDAE